MALRAIHHVDLCAGYGGMSLGLKLALPGHRTVLYCERETYCAATLVSRMEDEALDQAPVWDDVTTLDGLPWRGVVDLVSAGYPCQPFSCAGKRQGFDDPRHLWPHVYRVVQEMAPPLVFLENVEGHLRDGLREVLYDLHRAGYECEVGLFSAKEAGASHVRRRLWILGHHHHRGLLQEWGAWLRESVALDGQAQERGDDPDGSSRETEDVGDSRRGQRWQGDAEHHLQHEPPSAGLEVGSGLPLWPPFPEDTVAWAEMPVAYLPVEPQFRRALDGTREWLHRVHALGNGVVPVVAAYAFLTLLARLQGRLWERG